MTTPAFRGTFPSDLLYDIQHDMWLKEEGGEVVIGATSLGIYRAGVVIGFTGKPKGARIDKNRGLGTIECAKTVLAIHSPVSLLLTAANEAAEEQPDLINRDPYGCGWMVRGQPSDWIAEKHSLVDANTYRRHVTMVEPGAILL